MDWVEFLGCRIDLSKRPLVPRPETEFWVNKFLNSNPSVGSLGVRDSKLRILDMFTGSGCIGIAVASKLPNSQIVLSDKTNYISTPLPENARFVQSNLFENISEKFDFILANPPYVPEGEGVGGIMDEEPPDALYAGPDGLSVIRPFLAEAHKHLELGGGSPHSAGQVWMEFGTDQEGEIEKILLTLPYSKFSFHPDQYGVLRYLVANV
jgi:release factor glutamine methyltransferase